MRIPGSVWLLSILASCFLPGAVLAQQTLPGAWSGWARCVVSVQGPGYTDQQTHTWTIDAGRCGSRTSDGAGRAIHSGTGQSAGEFGAARGYVDSAAADEHGIDNSREHGDHHVA